MKKINFKKQALLIVVMLFMSLMVQAQLKVGNNPSTINANSELEVESTDKGLLLPRVALTGTANVAPLSAHVAGMTVYNTATAGDVTPGYYYNDGSKWIRLATGTTDLRLVNTSSHITQDAGVGSNGTSAGGAASVFIGTGAGNANAVDSITAVGFEALKSNTTGGRNTAFGMRALTSNTTGAVNVAVGQNALRANTTGSRNNAIGFASLQSNTTGAENVAIGWQSLTKNTIGIWNTAVGSAALNGNDSGARNTGLGYRAMFTNISGADNAAVGVNALYRNRTGTGNTAIGKNAGDTITTGSFNTFLGYQSNAFDSTLTNATAIGANAIVAASNSMVLGGTGVAAVKVGIGTTIPTNTLQVVGTARIDTLASGAAADSIVTADANGVLNRRTVTDVIGTAASKWTNDATNSRVALTNLSNGTTARPAGNQVYIKDDGNMAIGTPTVTTARFEINDSSATNTNGLRIIGVHPATASSNRSNSIESTTLPSDATNKNQNFGLAVNSAHRGTGTVSDARAIFGAATNFSTGTLNAAVFVQGRVQNSSTGTINSATGFGTTILNNSTGTITDANAVTVQILNPAGGTITNGYGVKIGAINATNKWSLHAGDATAPSYFAGSVGVGTDAPFSKLQVVGTTTINNGLVVQGGDFAAGFGAMWVQGTGGAQRLFISAKNGGSSATTDLTTINNSSIILNNDGGNVGIGTITPTNTLQVRGTARIDTLASGAATDSIVTADANGVLRRRTLSSVVAASDLRLVNTSSHITQDAGVGSNGSSAGGAASVFIGTGAGNANAVDSITAVGFEALKSNTTGGRNTAFGMRALTSNTTGSVNVAVGQNALRNNTTASRNNAFGFASLQSNTTGAENVAMGWQSLTKNTIGIWNTGVGSGALNGNDSGNYNTGLGYRAMFTNISGDDNAAVGVNALYANTTGTGNTAIGGRNAGSANVTGSNNIFIGYNANPASNNLTNATAIGANAIVGASNSMVLGGTGANAVNVGIGTTTPTHTLQVSGIARIDTLAIGSVTTPVALIHCPGFLVSGLNMDPSNTAVLPAFGSFNGRGLVIGRNRSGGGNEVNFLSARNLSAGGFSFSNLNSDSTLTTLVNLAVNGGTTLHVFGTARIDSLPSGAATDSIVTANANGVLRNRTLSNVFGAGLSGKSVQYTLTATDITNGFATITLSGIAGYSATANLFITLESDNAAPISVDRTNRTATTARIKFGSGPVTGDRIDVLVAQ